jgi:hypothetical protein
MLIKTSQGWELPKYKVNYTQNGENIEQYVGIEGKQWWLDYSTTWKMPVLFTDLTYTPEQLYRLTKVQQMGPGYQDIIEDYVINGNIPNADPFSMLRIEQLETLVLQMAGVI